MRFIVELEVDLDDSAKDMEDVIEEALRDFGRDARATYYPEENN